MIVCMLLHSINPACNQPLHESLMFLSFWCGGTQLFRMILARLNFTVSDERGRTSRHIKTSEQSEVQPRWIRDQLLKYSFFMFVHDNLDWCGGHTNREHKYSTSKAKERGVHIVNRMVSYHESDHYKL